MDEEFLMLACLMACAAITFILLEEEEEEGVDNGPNINEIVNAVGAFRRMRKRAFSGDDNQQQRKRKLYDCERGQNCLVADYLGPDPLYGAHYERIFRVTRGITERVMQVVGNAGFFTHKKLITGDVGIHPEVKVHMALKTIAFGCSSAAFVDYFQMGFTSGRESVKEFCRAIAKSELKDRYLRKMTKADAKRVSALHEAEWGVPGCIGCLDCMHVFWRLCPVAWQGQHKGKEGSPSIVLEGLADYNLWLWHLTFGLPGTLNDINIWDQSSLLRMLIDGYFCNEVDFMFRIADEVFDTLWFFVDGIYPELSRFVKTLSVPLTKMETKYSDWQESCRKSVERAFGVAQRKWQILCRPVELWHEDDIECIVETCFILHNMMVEVRIEREQQESEDWCQLLGVDGEATAEGDDDDDDDDSFIGGHDIDVDNTAVASKPLLTNRINLVNSQWPMGGSE